MKNIIGSFLKMNPIGRIGALAGIVVSLSGIILWVISSFFNPYVIGGIAEETIPVTFTFLGLPAILGCIASLYGTIWLMYVVFIYSLPLSLYIAGAPSIFRFFILVSLGYLVSAIFLTINKKIRNKRHTEEL